MIPSFVYVQTGVFFKVCLIGGRCFQPERTGRLSLLGKGWLAALPRIPSRDEGAQGKRVWLFPLSPRVPSNPLSGAVPQVCNSHSVAGEPGGEGADWPVRTVLRVGGSR